MAHLFTAIAAMKVYPLTTAIWICFKRTEHVFYFSKNLMHPRKCFISKSLFLQRTAGDYRKQMCLQTLFIFYDITVEVCKWK